MPRVDRDWTEGILDNASIRDALVFAAGWQRREWSVVTLPRDLGVEVETGPTPAGSLGAAINTGVHRGIGLNEMLEGTRGHVPVLAHECGHLFQPAGYGLCRSSIQMGRREREAWWIASILAVPLDAVRHVKLWGDDPSVAAQQLGLPRAMISMRKSIALIFDELPPERLAYPRVMLETATIAMQVWIYNFSQQLADRGRA